MSSKSRSRSRSSSRSPKYSRRGRDESMSPIRTASGASLRTPKNYNSANRSYNYNNNYGYRNYNRGYYNQRGYYNRWNRGRGNWRGQYNYRNQWNDRRRYNSRSDRSRSKSRSRSYDSRDSRSSSYDRSRSRSRSRDRKRRRTRSRSDRKSRSRSPPPKPVDTPKSAEKKSPLKQEETKQAAITVPSTTELVAEPDANPEETCNDEKDVHFAETSAFTRSRWETPDGSPGKIESADMDFSQDEIFDRWDDDKLREYLLKSKGQKIRKESKKSTDSVEQEKVISKKKKKKAKKVSISRESQEKTRQSSSHDVSSDSSFSPIHKAPEKKKAADGQEKYLPPEYDDDEDDNQSVEMQENSPSHSNEPYYPQEGRKDEKVEAVQYPFAHIKPAIPPPTQPPPPKPPTPVPPPAPALPSISEVQVLGPDGKPMKLVPISIPGPDGNMIQVMQLQPIGMPQIVPQPPSEPPKPPPKPVEPPKLQQKGPPPVAYPSQHQYQSALDAGRSSRAVEEKGTVLKMPPNLFPLSTNDHAANLRKMEMSQKSIHKQEVTKTRFKPKPAGSWASELSKKEPEVLAPNPIPQIDPTAKNVNVEQKGQSIPNLLDASGKPKSTDTGIFTEQKIPTITTTQSIRKVLPPRRSEQMEWDEGKKELESHKNEISEPSNQETVKSRRDKVDQLVVMERNASQTEKKRESTSKSLSKEPDSSENEGSQDRKQERNLSSEESGDEVVKRKKDKKRKKKNKKKQKEDEGVAKKKKKKQKEKSIEKNVVISLEHESIRSKKDIKSFEEMNKKAKEDNLVRGIDENLPLSHVRSMVPRKDDAGSKPIFQHLTNDDLASSSSYEDRFVSLFGSGPIEPAPKKEERIDLTKKSVRKFKVNVEGPRAVSHMTEMPVSERIRHFKEGTDVMTDHSSQRVSLNISGLSGKTKSSASRSRSRSVSSSASSEPPKKVKKKKKKTRRSSSRSSSRSRSRSLPAAYGGDDEKAPGKRRQRDDSEGESRRRSRDRYSRSPSSSGDDRDRGRRQMYYNRNNQGHYYNNRGRGFYQNRNRGWYNNRGGYRGRWNNWNQGWNRNQNWRNQRYRDRYSRERSRSKSRSDRSSSSRDDRRSRSPARDKSPERQNSENLKKDDQQQKAGHEDTGGTDAKASQNIFEDEKPPGVD